ncbi:MAG: hypothetical protein QM762_03410 [Chryseolinea sp.]
MRIRVLSLACLLASLFACERADDLEQKKLSSNYLPIEVGNYWDFSGVNAKTNEIVMHREVTGVANLNGHDYYLIVSKVPSNSSIVDSAYYRQDNDGNVYTYRKSLGIEELKYKLNAIDGDTWSYPFVDDDEMDVTLNVGAIEMPSRTVENCKNYYYNVVQWADEEHTNSLAPGVGFLKEYSNAWGSGLILSKAWIGGNVIEF